MLSGKTGYKIVCVCACKNDLNFIVKNYMCYIVYTCPYMHKNGKQIKYNNDFSLGGGILVDFYFLLYTFLYFSKCSNVSIS